MKTRFPNNGARNSFRFTRLRHSNFRWRAWTRSEMNSALLSIAGAALGEGWTFTKLSPIG